MHSSIMLPLQNTGACGRHALQVDLQNQDVLGSVLLPFHSHATTLLEHYGPFSPLSEHHTLVYHPSSRIYGNKHSSGDTRNRCVSCLSSINIHPPTPPCNFSSMQHQGKYGKLCRKLSPSSDPASSTFKDSTSSCSYSERTAVDTSSSPAKWVEPCLRGPMHEFTSHQGRWYALRMQNSS